MNFRKLLPLLVLLCCAFGAGAQYNPWWKWARADTNAALTFSGGGSVLAAKGGKALWGLHDCQPDGGEQLCDGYLDAL